MSPPTAFFVGPAAPLLPRHPYRSRVNQRAIPRTLSLPPAMQPVHHVGMTQTSPSPTAIPSPFLDAPPVVIGGGPAGALVASLLSLHGIPVTVLERRLDFASFDITKSYLMVVDTRGREALSRVPKLLDIVTANAIKGNGIHLKMLQKNGKFKSLRTFGRTSNVTADCMVMRISLAECLANHMRTVDTIDAQFGVETEALEFLDDGMAQITYTTADGERKAITTRCVIACDGKNSFVAKQIDQRARERPEAYITSNGAGDGVFQSASHEVSLKSLVLDPDFIGEPRHGIGFCWRNTTFCNHALCRLEE